MTCIDQLAFIAIARTAALVLHIDAIFILLPVCRNFVSLLRRTPLNDIIPFDKNITFHKATGWSIFFFTIVHVLAHIVNVIRLVVNDKGMVSAGVKVKNFFLIGVLSGPALTGWIMTACLFTMVWFAMEKRRRANFERFWYSHHLFLVFFINWQLHGMFCMIKPDRPPLCSSNTIGVFWVGLSFVSTVFRFSKYTSVTGLWVDAFGYTSVFCVKFALGILLLCPRSSNTLRMSWSFKSRKRRPPLGQANIFSCRAPKSLTSNGTPSP